jgi:hypothetical protein
MSQHNVFRTMLQNIRPRPRTDDDQFAAGRTKVEARFAQVLAAAPGH